MDEGLNTELSSLAEEIDDAALVERIQSGDQSAEALLHGRYSARLFYIALVRQRSRHDAEDASSETLLRALSSIRGGQLRTPSALASFLFRTLDNVILEMCRREQRAGRREFDSEASIPDYFLNLDVKGAIERTIERLKPRERDFLRMYYYEELPKEEIARRTGITSERVRLLKSRALKSFREQYLRLHKKPDTNRGWRSPV